MSVVILDFGSQYSQLIAKAIRSLSVYCEIFPYNNFSFESKDFDALILSGSPYSVKKNLEVDSAIKKLISKKPILGICYGAQYLAKLLGANIVTSKFREYGSAKLSSVDEKSKLLKGIKKGNIVWMSHADCIQYNNNYNYNFSITSQTKDESIASFESNIKKIYGLQFHPEVNNTNQGIDIFKNFLFSISKIKKNWFPEKFVDSTVINIKEKVKKDKVILAISGGIDSTLTAFLLKKAIGNNLYCIFVNNGLLRKGEFEEVLDNYKKLGLNVKGINAKKEFLKALKSITEPEKKRKVIGKIFINIFEKEAKSINNLNWLAQGSIYPDFIESASNNPNADSIKSHHNVGGIPKNMNLKLIEPLRELFKDDVRNISKYMNIPEYFVNRHPFPGPGLSIRIMGEITEEKINILQEADYIFINALKENNLYEKVWQAGVILLSDKAVGVMGDSRTYENIVALRAVSSINAMTADWVKLPYEFLSNVSNEIINNVKGINRVVYDISSKPPATIEWE